MRWWGWLLIGALSGVLVGGVAAAQTVAPRIVQGGDGSLYVLKDGVRYLVAADAIDDDELGAYADGGTLGGTDLVAALAGSGAGGDTAQAKPSASGQAPATTQPPVVPGTTRAGVPSLTITRVQGAAPGGTATVTAQATPGATCSLAYRTPAGTQSSATGLGQQTANASGVATWAWVIDGNTKTGLGTISVSCGNLGANDVIQIGSNSDAKR